MTWHDVKSCYCDWRVQSGVGVGGVMIWCKDGREMVLKNTGYWVYSHGPFVTTYVFCEKQWYSYEISLWYFMLFGRCEISLWDFTPFGHCPKHGCFQMIGDWVLVARRWCKGMHVRVSSEERGVDGEYVKKGREWLVVNEVWVCLLCRPRFFLWRFFCRLSCVDCERTLPLFLAEPLCDFMLCAAHFSYEISEWDFHAFCGPLWDFLMRFHVYQLHSYLMRFRCESSCFLLHNFIMKLPYEISCFLTSWDYMLFWPLRDFFMWFPFEFFSFCWIILLWYFMLLCRYEISFWDTMLFVSYLSFMQRHAWEWVREKGEGWWICREWASCFLVVMRFPGDFMLFWP